MPETPMLRQYRRIKAEHSDAVLLFRLGDFYETFFEDAAIASRVCGIALTSRDKGPEGMPLAGVPYHAADEYIAKLLAAGYKVAVCDQVEDPRSAKGIVRREVTRVITPGTLIDEAALRGDRNNYLAAVAIDGDAAGIAFVDLSTGEFGLTEVSSAGVADEMSRLGATEVLVPESAREGEAPYVGRSTGPGETPPARTVRPDWAFDVERAREILLEHFGVSTLAGFGVEEMELALRAGGAVLDYLRETQKRPLGHIARLTPRRPAEYLHLDRSTARNLELVESMRGRSVERTLLGGLDRTRTAMGSRRMREWVLSPLARQDPINARLDAVAELAAGGLLRAELREELSSVQDVERLAAKTTSGRASARDLLALAASLEAVPVIRETLEACKAALAAELAACLEPLDVLAARIRSTFVPDPPAVVREGGMIAQGVDAELDRLREVRSGGKAWIAELQRKEVERTGISSLKVGFNRVFGYYIEVTRPHLDKVPPDYIRKQTIVNAERFVTPELKERESEILSADEKIIEIEHRIFCELRDEAAKAAPSLVRTAGAVGRIDCLASLAEVASTNGWTRPVVDDSLVLEARSLRHPVIEGSLPAGKYVPNDLRVDGESEQLLVLTGPNMSGKSTFIRSAAVLVVMAQMGSFVPARSARVGVADSLFVRAGATDDIAGGSSTFMVEMAETANLLNNSTQRSVIILDEVGRGTSTYDGVAVAWATAEYIHDWPRGGGRGPRTLFATHFHELTRLADVCERVRNYHVAVREDEGEVTFLHAVRPGGTDRSFGVHVARLAGMPAPVIERASEILARLESMASQGATMGPEELGAQMALFDAGRLPAKRKRRPKPAPEAAPPEPSEVEKELLAAEPEKMTPLEAMRLLDELRKKLGR